MDSIVLKALQRDVIDRYPTAQALHDDIHRYLTGMPVEARPWYPGYRLGKLLLRHRAAVALGAAVVVLTAASIELGYPRKEVPHGDESDASARSVHAYRGETDDAFRWLDQAYQQHDTGMTMVRVDPLLQNLRGDPRYVGVLRRMGLAEARRAG